MQTFIFVSEGYTNLLITFQILKMVPLLSSIMGTLPLHPLSKIGIGDYPLLCQH